MCLVITDGKIKQRCCNCSGLCKKDQQRAVKMNSVEAAEEAVSIPSLFREAQGAQQQHSTLQQAS